MFKLLRHFVLCSLVAAAAAVALPARAQSTMVRLQTTMGAIDMALVADAPITTANFLAYVRGGDYVDVFVHRNAWLNSTMPFVIQAGGFRWPATGGIQSVATHPAIVNEFSTARSNLRGTVAMAKLGTDPNSATSQWFINMGNNSGNLDTQNGGFTVFARVTAPGMATADRIAALPNVNAGSPFNELPVAGWQGGTSVQRSNVVRITSVAELPTQSQADRIFNYLEAAYPNTSARRPAAGARRSATSIATTPASMRTSASRTPPCGTWCRPSTATSTRWARWPTGWRRPRPPVTDAVAPRPTFFLQPPTAPSDGPRPAWRLTWSNGQGTQGAAVGAR